jgi:hypothetical protein
MVCLIFQLKSREKLLYLPKRDLKSLYRSYMHSLAPQAYFLWDRSTFYGVARTSQSQWQIQGVRGIRDEQEINAWHYRWSADILTSILIDTIFALQVRSLSIYAIVSDTSRDHKSKFYVW